MNRKGLNLGTLGKKVAFRLDDERHSQLVEIARKEGFSVSIIVRHLVLRYLEDRSRFARVQ